MCGITGKLHWGKNYDPNLISKMNKAIAHRGPDDEGKLELGEISLGHRRLSIIDLSSDAKQPMSETTNRYHIVFNGEIYNYLEIKKNLEAEGYIFKNKSDTEVVLNSYIKWGSSCLNKFNGMFSFVIWDNENKELFAARDRFGKKPFYYTYKNLCFTFGSEIKALLEDETISKEKNLEALNCYLALGYILAPLSFYSDILKLKPGHFIKITNQGKTFEETNYWNYADSFRIKTKQSESEIKENILNHLEQSVRYRLIADVEVGAFLSGGIDSSSIVAQIKKLSDKQLHTFNIGFEEKSYNEYDDALKVSQIFKTSHHAALIQNEDTLDLINQSIDVFDEPFADNSLIPMYQVSKMASEKVKVVLSGDGADEIFAGYITYKADHYFNFYRKTPLAFRRGFATLAGNLRAGNNKIDFKYKLKQFLAGSDSDQIKAHYSWRLYFNTEERIKILGEKNRELVQATDPIHTFKKYYNEVKDLHWLDQHLYVDAMTWLTDDILTKVDRTTMHSGLEARAPYLDVNFVNYAASIPAELKFKNAKTKYILKSALEKLLPESVLYKKKSGFNAPVGKWIKNNETDEFKAFNKFVYDKKI
ncbi:MAG: asparagine synthase (glutamine-hydrolyzing) [Sphingobacteriaceae bacterium]|nr:asparagine synthase (glutamine-hydrolyzing) [Sphingobacteriaceae bacterium]